MSYKNLLLLPLVGLLLPSCFVAKDYQQPGEVVNEAYFRSDLLPEDSLRHAYNLPGENSFY